VFQESRGGREEVITDTVKEGFLEMRQEWRIV
jgi:hypothetical protein